MRILRSSTTSQVAAAQAIMRASMVHDQSYGYVAEWHWDIDHALEMYVDNARHALMLAMEHDEVLGTCCVRTGGPLVPPHHPDLAVRYADRPRVAQLTRLVTIPKARRMGVASQLVTACREFAHLQGFQVAYLHTNARTPGALEFWRSTGASVVRDDRKDWDRDPRLATVHFEFRLGDGTPPQ